MFSDVRLGLKQHNPKEIEKHVRLSPEDVDPLISRCPKDWAFGHHWDGDDLANKTWGDCGPAAAVNWCKIMALSAGRPDLVLSAEDALAFYRDMGWDGTIAGDDGVVLLDMMCLWMKRALKGIKIEGFFVVNHQDDLHVATAVTLAPLIVGATLTKSCQNSNLWDAEAAASSQVWGGHAYLYFSDSPGGGNGKTWGRSVFTDAAFRKARWNEAYLPICPELMPHVKLDRLVQIARQL